ncbi:alpha-1,6-mannosyltransferase [Tamaricihabitans halophyticus]|uniref:Alpha-1,6-mannosyltransferase n=1 Tax=Tamaricihabitans halophyticus TaxID=1262583 RepID=A0A4R2QB75_9PSEU|nr:polyprenol phosphomannose-dependent alpha 1,6 mannosyltransferase MptB [Tamaricihabitans halophyticus]TCP46213.1 alpha-1,6-mannosyltransferase [Tamaricihabitans halophyticus]
MTAGRTVDGGAVTHAPPPAASGEQYQPLDAGERRSLEAIRRFGTVGALLLAVGSLGAGAAPVVNPLQGWPVIGLFGRLSTVALACAFAGICMMIIGWLLLGRFARPKAARIVSRAQLDRTLLMWMLPLLVIPPLFSRDVYSYLAQSEIVYRGLDPYIQGPANALGVEHPLTRGVSNIWRDTPAPYGPLFLMFGSGISSLVGNQVVTGVMLQRLFALAGVALIVWALPRLAKRFGVHPSTALWLGAANPLVLFHLIAGAHNEALGIGLMMAGLVFGLRWLPKRPSGQPPPPTQRHELLGILLGSVVLSLAVLVKVQAIVALGFYGVMLARRWGGGYRHLFRAAAIQTVVVTITVVGFCVGSGLGFGWIGALDTPAMVRSWMSPVSQLGNLGGVLGMWFDLGDHRVAVTSVIYGFATVLAAVITLKLLWDAFHGKRHPVIALGAALGAFLILHPALQPWYLLWAVIPLAASAGDSRFRKLATLVSAVLAVVLPPTGSTFDGRSFVLTQGYLGGIVVVLIALVVLHRVYPLTRRRSASDQ